MIALSRSSCLDNIHYYKYYTLLLQLLLLSTITTVGFSSTSLSSSASLSLSLYIFIGITSMVLIFFLLIPHFPYIPFASLLFSVSSDRSSGSFCLQHLLFYGHLCFCLHPLYNLLFPLLFGELVLLLLLPALPSLPIQTMACTSKPPMST